MYTNGGVNMRNIKDKMVEMENRNNPGLQKLGENSKS